MGRKYYCEYCDKRFKDDANIRKKHIEGLPHQKARNEHYAHFKSAKEILQEEHKKRPCAKFSNGTCQFGATCRFSHYTPVQLAKIEKQVQLEKQMEMEGQRPKVYSKNLINDFLEKRKMAKEQEEQQLLRELFRYPDELLRMGDDLPPSLRPIDPKMLKKDFSPTFYG